MKGTDCFKRTIKEYLDERATTDELFAKNYHNPDKNLEDCITYILNYVHQSGCNGFADDEIYGLAVHYYDEADIDIGRPMDCQVAVNHVVELTEAEKAEVRQAAIRKYHDDELRKMQERAAKRHTVTHTSTQAEQLNLFQ